MDGRRGAGRLGNGGHELMEVLVTQCMRASGANKMTIEIDVVADDALDRAMRRAVEYGIKAVSSHSTLLAWSMGAIRSRCPVRHFRQSLCSLACREPDGGRVPPFWLYGGL